MLLTLYMHIWFLFVCFFFCKITIIVVMLTRTAKRFVLKHYVKGNCASSHRPGYSAKTLKWFIRHSVFKSLARPLAFCTFAVVVVVI